MYHEQIVLNAVNFGPSGTGAFNGGVVDLTPWWDGTVWDEVTFYIHVSAVNGSPTGGSLTAKFQNVIPFTGGGQQFSSYRAFDLDAAQKSSMIAEGEDWGTIIAFGGSTPTTVKRTIRDFGSRINLRLDASTLSGGSSPTFTVTVTMAMKTNTGGNSGLKGSATGSAVPGTGVYSGMIDASGNLIGMGNAVRNVTAAAGTSSLSVVPSNYNGATFDAVRSPSVFKTATATASGDTAVWTPTSGKKFRLQRYSIQVTADAATSGGGDIDIVLRDATTGLAAAFSTYIPAVAGTTFGNTNQTGWIDFGNGILSAAANNVLNVNLSAALTSGKVRVVAIGTEE